jgi:hypothetical protein
MNQQSLTAQISSLMGSRKLHDRVNFRGLQISVENRKHSLRQGVGKGGKPWAVFMRLPYGYLRGGNQMGVDGDAVDVFVGPNLDAPNVYVIHTQDPETQKYDEDKVFLGIMTAPEAKLEFLRNYDSPGHFQSMDTIPFEEFRERMLDGDGKGKKIEAQTKIVEYSKPFGFGLEAFGTSEGAEKGWMSRHPDYKKCTRCKGTGQTSGTHQDKPGHVGGGFFTRKCSTCGGEGYVYKPKLSASSLSIGDQVVVDGINYRWVVKGFKGKLLVLEKKGQFNEQQPRVILRLPSSVTKI